MLYLIYLCFWHFIFSKFYVKNHNKTKNYRINNNKTAADKSFECKTKIKGSTPNKNSRLGAEVVALLEYLSNFWISLDLTLTDCEIELDLSWARNCIVSEISRTAAGAGDNPAGATLAT